MPTPQETIWAREPHTAAKHDMLVRYLAAWFPIIAKGFPTKGLTYVDAFAGPGKYKDGSEGSPLLALRQAYRPDVRALDAALAIQGQSGWLRKSDGEKKTTERLDWPSQALVGG